MHEDGPNVVFGKHMRIQRHYSSTYPSRSPPLTRENKTPEAAKPMALLPSCR
jgi:hypothetical protein